jgi:phage shock protein PspC (stress-responsive transcriptional regulator)
MKHTQSKFCRFAGDATLIAGVCVGLAYFNRTPIIIVRVLFLLMALISGPLLLVIYIGLWILLPKVKQPDDLYRLTENNYDN